MADKVDLQPKPWQFWRRTFSSLKYRNYRLVWLGSCTEHMGEQIEIMAIAWLMKELTESPFYLGLLAVFRVGPMVFSALAGGVMTDRFDRRRILIYCLAAGGLISLVLLVLVRTGVVAPWHLLVATALGGILIGFNHPARFAIIPNLTPKEEWMNAIALDTVSVRTAMVIVAPLTGYLIAWFGTTPLFGARALGMGIAILWLLMAQIPSTPPGAKKANAWLNLTGGLKYAIGSGLILSLVLVFALREFQAETGNVFLPFFADDILKSGAEGFGYLSTAQSAGALIGLFGISSLGNFKYKGWLILISGIASGVFLTVFPLSNWLFLSFVLLLGANLFATVFENVARTALQTIVPDEMRGRMMSLREVVRGLFGTWVAYGLGVGGEHLGVVTAAVLFGLFITAVVCAMAVFIPSFRKL